MAVAAALKDKVEERGGREEEAEADPVRSREMGTNAALLLLPVETCVPRASGAVEKPFVLAYKASGLAPTLAAVVPAAPALVTVGAAAETETLVAEA